MKYYRITKWIEVTAVVCVPDAADEEAMHQLAGSIKCHVEDDIGNPLPKNGWPLRSLESSTITQQPTDIQELQWFRVHYVHTGKFEAIYKVLATSQEEANAYLESHRLECDCEEVFPISDNYEQYL